MNENDLPDFSKMNLDFSQFHPLDHFPGTPRCFSLPPKDKNSITHHLKLAWSFKWKEVVKASLFCRYGYHEMVGGWGLEEEESFTACMNCWKKEA